jgi:cell division protein FtsB
MRKHIEALSNEDLRVIEEEARSHGMVKPGEKVYLLRSKTEDSDK